MKHIIFRYLYTIGRYRKITISTNNTTHFTKFSSRVEEFLLPSSRRNYTVYHWRLQIPLRQNTRHLKCVGLSNVFSFPLKNSVRIVRSAKSSSWQNLKKQRRTTKFLRNLKPHILQRIRKNFLGLKQRLEVGKRENRRLQRESIDKHWNL